MIEPADQWLLLAKESQLLDHRRHGLLRAGADHRFECAAIIERGVPGIADAG